MDLPLPPDFREFLSLLGSERVEYLVVGGYAVAYHGYVRPTGDLDVWVGTGAGNAERAVGAIEKFGFRATGLTAEVLREPARVIRMGVPPVRIEVLSSISGVEFGGCFARRVEAEFDSVRACIICLADLLANKRAAGRSKDRNDVEQLEGPERA